MKSYLLIRTGNPDRCESAFGRKRNYLGLTSIIDLQRPFTGKAFGSEVFFIPSVHLARATGCQPGLLRKGFLIGGGFAPSFFVPPMEKMPDIHTKQSVRRTAQAGWTDAWHRRRLRYASYRHGHVDYGRDCMKARGHGFGGLLGADVLGPCRPPATRGAHSRKVTEGGTPGRYPPKGGCKNPPVVSVRTMPDAKATTDAAETGGGWGPPL